jgi:hypothetical protein
MAALQAIGCSFIGYLGKGSIIPRINDSCRTDSRADPAAIAEIPVYDYSFHQIHPFEYQFPLKT